MKIYTKKGDGGSTTFYTGESVRKNDPRIEAVGTIDELNSLIGLVMAQMGACENSENGIHTEIKSTLERVQHDLFTVGAELTMLSARQMPESFKMPTKRKINESVASRVVGTTAPKKEILSEKLADWSTLGMIMQVISEN